MVLKPTRTFHSMLFMGFLAIPAVSAHGQEDALPRQIVLHTFSICCATRPPASWAWPSPRVCPRSAGFAPG